MKKFSGIFLLSFGLLLIVSCGQNIEAKDGAGDKKWFTYNAGAEKAGKDKKPMMVDVYTDWCQPCKILDRNTFQNPRIKEILEKSFVPVKLNPETEKEKILFEGKRYTAMDFVGHMGVEGFPTMLFFDKSGKFVNAVVGYIPPEDFEKVLDYYLNEKYKSGLSLEKILRGS